MDGHCKHISIHSRESLVLFVSFTLLRVCQRPEEEEDKMRLKENEKTRLSLLEEKLADALTLLLQLRNKVHTLAHTHTCSNLA